MNRQWYLIPNPSPGVVYLTPTGARFYAHLDLVPITRERAAEVIGVAMVDSTEAAAMAREPVDVESLLTS